MTGNCSCSWAELKYMMCSGMQMNGRGEEIEDGVICCISDNGLPSFSGASMSLRSVESMGPSQACGH